MTLHSMLGTVGFAVWQAVPFAVLALLHRRSGLSDLGTVVTAVIFTGLTVLGYIEVERSDSSTAALGFLIYPIWFTLLVVVAYLVDIGTRHVLQRL